MLDHYDDVVETCRSHGVTPIVTLQHFTLPKWFADDRGWLHPDAVSRFVVYTRAVMERIGAHVPYVCTINEPGQMLTRGYLGTFPTPPFVRDLDQFDAAAEAVNSVHRAAREEIKGIFPSTKVGMAHSLQHWNPGPGAEPLLGWVRELYEDRFLAETADDDFIGVQTYTRIDVEAPALARPFLEGLVRSRLVQERVLLPLLRSTAKRFEHSDGSSDERLTEMGYPWAPDAVVHSLRRMADVFPGKELLITEHGIATDRDEERIEYVEAALRAIHGLIEDGLPISGYLHWSLLDNFEWWDGYRPKFGLVGVDRATQDRKVKPSGRWLGGVARANAL